MWLQAGSWRIDVHEEERVRQRQPLSSGLVEYVLLILRRAALTLRIPVSVGTVKFCSTIGKANDLSELERLVAGWQNWKLSTLRSAQIFLSVVALEPDSAASEWIVVAVAGKIQGRSISPQQEHVVTVYDAKGRSHLPLKLGVLVGGLLSGGARPRRR